MIPQDLQIISGFHPLDSDEIETVSGGQSPGRADYNHDYSYREYYRPVYPSAPPIMTAGGRA